MAHKINALGCVVHFGKQLSLSRWKAIDNMRDTIMHILDHSKSKIILETSAGQGSELCHKLLEFANFYGSFSPKYKRRLGICIDTCHIFASGYDIRTKAGVNAFLKEFDDLIGLENVMLIHLNDSERELGTRVDRHANLGDGEIGMPGLREFVRFAVKRNIPVILETPGHGYTKEIPMIGELAIKYSRE